MSTAQTASLVAFLVLVVLPCAVFVGGALWLAWRDRHGHRKDAGPLRHLTSEERYAEQDRPPHPIPEQRRSRQDAER